MPAPVVLFVYNRPSHTLKVLKALAANELARSSILFIYADGPKPDANDQDLLAIKETRTCIKSYQWCHKVFIKENENNLGLANSIIGGLNEIFNQHESAIILEDDIVTAPGFLAFMNAALTYYKKHEKVAGISGFSYPSLGTIDQVYFLPIGSSWGWATWKRQWTVTEFDTMKLLNSIERMELCQQFDFGNYEFLNILKAQSEEKLNSWAIRFYASFFLKEKCFVYSPKSLVQNIGFGSEATHTKLSDNFFSSIAISQNTAYAFREPIYDNITDEIREIFERKYRVHVTKPQSFCQKLINAFRRKLRFLIKL